MLKALMHILRILSPSPPPSPTGTATAENSPRSSSLFPSSSNRRKHGGLLNARGLSDELGGTSLISRGRASSYAAAMPTIDSPDGSPTDSMSAERGGESRSQPGLHRSLSEGSSMSRNHSDQSSDAFEPLKTNELPDSLRQSLQELDVAEEEPEIHDSIVLCSVALSNLAQIEDFRAALVSGGALSLLTRWLDIAAGVLSWHNNARLLSGTPVTAESDGYNSSKNVGLDINDMQKNEGQSLADAGRTDELPTEPSPNTGIHRSYSASSEVTTNGGMLPSGHPVYELINNISSAVASLTSSSNLPSGAVSASGRERRSSRHSNYSIGWIDAQVG